MIENSLVGSILTALSVSGVVLTVVAWLVRSIITHWLSKDIERFKKTIEHKNEMEVEKLKIDLNRMAVEEQIRFHQLHTKVFVTIARLYRLIVSTQMAMSAYFSIVTFSNGPSEEERAKKAGEAWNSLNIFFRLHEIYFDRKTCKSLDDYLKGLADLMIQFECRKESDNYAKKWHEVWSVLNTDMENLKRELGDSFRKKIGVEV